MKELIKIVFSDQLSKADLGDEPSSLAQAMSTLHFMRRDDSTIPLGRRRPMDACNNGGKVPEASDIDDFSNLIFKCALRNANETGHQTEVCRRLVLECASDNDSSNTNLKWCKDTVPSIAEHKQNEKEEN